MTPDGRDDRAGEPGPALETPPLTSLAPAERECPACRHRCPDSAAFCSRCGSALSPLSPASPDKDPLIEAVIDNRYRVRERVGQGGMGSVYLAEHVGIGKRVALKVLRSHLRTQPDLVRRFRREALVVSRLTDAHTITVFDYGVWEGLIYFVMEYLPGEDLGKVLERDVRLPPARALSIAHQICSSLAEAHAAGLVHRDLKPENVFLQQTGAGEEWVKVLDFGLAKIVREAPEPGDGPVPDPSFQTAHGALLGTPFFMAPEQVTGGPVDARTDLYALGALIYRMISGQYPHTGRTPMQVLESHLSGVVKPLEEAGAERRLPDGCDALVRRMLARDPDGRPGSAGEVAEALLAISRRAQIQDSSADWASRTWEAAKPEPLPPPEGPTRDEVVRFERSLRNRTVVRVALLLAFLGGAGYGAWQVVRPAGAPVLRAEVEPNDEPTDATPLTPGVEMQGHLGRRLHRETSDRDVFAVAVGPGEVRLDGSVTGVPGIDLVVEAFDAEVRPLFKVNARAKNEGEVLPLTTVRGPTVYIVIRGFWVQGELPVENSTDPYLLRVVTTPR